jgi:hypothetical protein
MATAPAPCLVAVIAVEQARARSTRADHERGSAPYDADAACVGGRRATSAAGLACSV